MFGGFGCTSVCIQRPERDVRYLAIAIPKEVWPSFLAWFSGKTIPEDSPLSWSSNTHIDGEDSMRAYWRVAIEGSPGLQYLRVTVQTPGDADSGQLPQTGELYATRTELFEALTTPSQRCLYVALQIPLLLSFSLPATWFQQLMSQDFVKGVSNTQEECRRQMERWRQDRRESYQMQLCQRDWTADSWTDVPEQRLGDSTTRVAELPFRAAGITWEPTTVMADKIFKLPADWLTQGCRRTAYYGEAALQFAGLDLSLSVEVWLNQHNYREMAVTPATQERVVLVDLLYRRLPVGPVLGRSRVAVPAWLFNNQDARPVTLLYELRGPDAPFSVTFAAERADSTAPQTTKAESSSKGKAKAKPAAKAKPKASTKTKR